MRPGISQLNLRSVDFDEACALQRRLWEARVAGSISDTLLFVEHPHTITIGRTGSIENLLVSPDELESLGCKLRTTDRGGDITYHGPGQLVCYPIVDLGAPFPDLDRYLRDLERVIIAALAVAGVRSRRITGATGVWTSFGKIAAIGVKVTRGVTMHGFSINVCPDLSWYERIIPCGLHGKRVTSLAQILDGPVAVEELIGPVTESFSQIFGRAVEARMPGDTAVEATSV